MAMQNVTAEALSEIAANARGDLDGQAVPKGDGTYLVDLSPEVTERLRSHALAGETISDTIVRLCRAARKARAN